MVWLCLFGLQARGQDKDKVFKDLMFLLAETNFTQTNSEELETLIRHWIDNPLPLNHCSKNNLLEFPGMSNKLADAIIGHREAFGPFISKYELQAVVGMPLEMALLLSSLTTLNEPNLLFAAPSWKSLQKGEHEWAKYVGLNLPASPSFQAESRGNSLQQCLRYRYHLGRNVYGGFTLEKDAGEQWGVLGDFSSFHFLKNGSGIIQQIALGDFQLNIGGGLNMSSAGLSRYPLAICLGNTGFKPYRSAGEYGFMRGLGIRLKKRNIQTDIWLSALPVSGNAMADSVSLTDIPSFIQMNGLHRTQNEYAKRHQVLQTSAGLNVKYNFKKQQVGCLFGKQQNFSKERLFEQFQLASYLLNSTNQQWGCYYQVTHKSSLMVVEYSLMANKQSAFLVHLLSSLSGSTDVQFVYRNYGLNYRNGFGLNQQSTGNEEGLLSMFQCKLSKKYLLQISADLYRSVSPKYLMDFPSYGSMHKWQLSYKPSKQKEWGLAYQYLFRQQNAQNDATRFQHPINQTRNQIHIYVKEEWNANLTFDWHIYPVFGSNRKAEKVQGFFAYQDMLVKLPLLKLKAEWRLAYYQCEDYLMRVYALEKDIQYRYGSFMAYQTGIYSYLLLTYKATKQLTLEAKMRINYQPNESTMSSGLTELDSNQQSSLGVQVLYKW